jgi:hypothetical protein
MRPASRDTPQHSAGFEVWILHSSFAFIDVCIGESVCVRLAEEADEVGRAKSAGASSTGWEKGYGCGEAFGARETFEGSTAVARRQPLR